jgi:cell division protein FtsB
MIIRYSKISFLTSKNVGAYPCGRPHMRKQHDKKQTKLNQTNPMKKLLTMLLFVAYFGAYAQTDREILLDISKQIVVNNAKIDATNAKIEALEKSMDKRFEAADKRLDGMDKRLDGMDKRLEFMQQLLLIIIPLVLTSVIGIVGFVLWDRRTAIKPIEEETKKEIEKLKEREQKLEDAIKKIIQIEPRFSGVI